MNKKIKEYLINKIEEMKACANSDDYTTEERQACRIALDAYKDALDYVCKPSKNHAKIHITTNTLRLISYEINGDLLLYHLRDSFPYKTTAELIGITKELLQKIDGLRFDGERCQRYDSVVECIAIETKKFLEQNDYTTRKLYEMDGQTIWENLIYV